MSDLQRLRGLSADDLNQLLDDIMARELGEPGSARATESLRHLVESGVIQLTKAGDALEGAPTDSRT